MSRAPHTAATSSHSDIDTQVRHPAHPGPAQYVQIAVLLAVITACEVAIYYIKALAPILVPALLALSIAKFSLVALFFMHLKFDSRLFSAMFVVGILVAVLVFIVVLTMLRVLFA